MLNAELVAQAARELATELPASPDGDMWTAAYFVASSLRLEGIESTPESVLEAGSESYRRSVAASRATGDHFAVAAGQCTASPEPAAAVSARR